MGLVLMCRLRFSQDQMKAARVELTAGRTVREVSHKYGISKNTLYRWRGKLTNEQQQDGKDRLLSLEEEHQRLKNKFAELTLDYAALRAALVGDGDPVNRCVNGIRRRSARPDRSHYTSPGLTDSFSRL